MLGHPVVDAIAKPPAALAKKLLAQITSDRATQGAEGKFDDWAIEAFEAFLGRTWRSGGCASAIDNINSGKATPPSGLDGSFTAWCKFLPRVKGAIC